MYMYAVTEETAVRSEKIPPPESIGSSSTTQHKLLPCMCIWHDTFTFYVGKTIIN